MSRVSYSNEEYFPGQFDLWQANCRRSIAGKKGQAALRELEQALLALPEKRLMELGLPRMVAWKIVAMNDDELDWRYDKEANKRVEITPEEPYKMVPRKIQGWLVTKEIV